MQIPAKVSMAITGATAVLGALIGATSQFTTLFGQGKASAIIAGLSLGFIAVGALGTWLHAYSDSSPGPLAPPDPPNVQKAMAENATIVALKKG